MKFQGAAYFKKRDLAKMQNEDSRNRGEARRSEVASRFGRISHRYNQTKTAFMPFMSDQRDIQRFLGR